MRSHSLGEEQHKFILGPKLAEARVPAFEVEYDIGGSGAAPSYGLVPQEWCSPMVMNPRGEPGTPSGFEGVVPGSYGRDLFLHVIEMGCTYVCFSAVTGALTGRVLIGNGDAFWGPHVSSAIDLFDWYELWLNHMGAGRDTRALELTSPRLRAHPDRHRMVPKI
ncbi:hypothetical protein ADK75_13335 [Streptomyces virginiae]|uniref:Knr4/Smi1-like domain-containing protein n=1 Tax=Streptomyces virginiae TaxID=1961 RepID=A0A0L8MW98_STRVG|nr:hypothetical protein ADK75_13335 [Streptomyces virginiae]